MTLSNKQEGEIRNGIAYPKQRTQGTANPEAPVVSAPLVSKPTRYTHVCGCPLGEPMPCDRVKCSACVWLRVVEAQPATQVRTTAPLVSKLLQYYQGCKTFLSHRRGGRGFRNSMRGGRWTLSPYIHFLQVRYGALLNGMANKVLKLWRWCNER